MTGPLVPRYTGVHEWMPHQSGPETGLVTLMTNCSGMTSPVAGPGYPCGQLAGQQDVCRKDLCIARDDALRRQRKLISYSMLTLRRVFFRALFRSTGSSAISARE
jgi:hypothetical protein